MDSYFSSSDSDEEFFERPVRGPRPTRPAPASPRGAGRALEEQLESLEAAQEALDDARAALETLGAAVKALSGLREELPPWLKALAVVEAAAGLPDALDALETASQHAAHEHEQLCAGEPLDRSAARGFKITRLALSALRLYHTKAAKRFDEAFKALDLESSRSKSPVLASPPRSASHKAGKEGNADGGDNDNDNDDNDDDDEDNGNDNDDDNVSSSSAPSEPPAAVPDSAAANAVADTAPSHEAVSPRSFTASRPPPIPVRRSAPPRSSKAGGMEDDPFSEQPLADIDASVSRARSRSKTPQQPTSAPASPRRGGAGPVSDNDSLIIIGGAERTRSPTQTVEESAAVSPKLNESGAFSLSLKDSGLFTRPDRSLVDPDQTPAPLQVTPARPPLPTSQSMSAVAPRSPRGAGVLTVGRKRGSNIRQPLASSSGSVPTAVATSAQPLRTDPPVGLKWGSDERPLKQLCKETEFPPLEDPVLRFEVSRRAGLLTSANFSITVTNNPEPQISVYEVKAQANVVRPISNVVKVTRSNKNHRKLKIWWRGEPVERFLFKSGREREIFVEAVWTYRQLVPRPVLYAEPIEIFIGTFNLGDAMPPASNIHLWLQPEKKFDLYVVSAQEGNYEIEKGDAKNAEQHFFSLIESSLGPNYVRVAQLSLLHIRHCVYVAKRHSHKVSNVRKGTVATGIGNVIGNKGGCFTSMTFNETSLCFVGCHLAAREERYEQRCTNVQQILQGINANQPTGLGPDTWFDYIFWTGDLNYRLTADRDAVCAWAKEGNVEKLLESDQLMLARSERKAFYQFTEPPIHFLPSYRYDRGSSVFSEEKMRTPSYCDRVLYKSKPGLTPTVTAYDCIHEVTTSDHHPVYATIIVDTLLTGILHSRRPCYIEIKDLSALGCPALVAEQPPVAMFYASFLKPQKQTRRGLVKDGTVTWEDALVPKLKPFFSSRELLALSYICVALRDGKNEIGQACIPLNDACGPQAADFVVKLVNGGLPAGELRGKVHIKWVRDEDGSVADPMDGATGETSRAPAALGTTGLSGSGKIALTSSGGAGGGNASSGGLLGNSGNAMTSGSGALSKRPVASIAGGGAILKQGYMLKQGSKVKSWKRRWFVFHENGELAYYPDPKSPKYLDKLHVDKVSAFPGAGKQNCLAVDTGKRRLLFCADTEADYDAWMRLLQDHCDRLVRLDSALEK